MLSGKLPTGTVEANGGTDQRQAGHGAAAGDRAATRESVTVDERGRGGATRTPDAGGGASAAALERQLAAERAARRETVVRYERLLDRRARGDDEREPRRASTGVGHTRAWLRRAWCRLRLRMSRRE